MAFAFRLRANRAISFSISPEPAPTSSTLNSFQVEFIYFFQQRLSQCPTVTDPAVDKSYLAKKRLVFFIGVIACVDSLGLVASFFEHEIE